MLNAIGDHNLDLEELKRRVHCMVPSNRRRKDGAQFSPKAGKAGENGTSFFAKTYLPCLTVHLRGKIAPHQASARVCRKPIATSAPLLAFVEDVLRTFWRKVIMNQSAGESDGASYCGRHRSRGCTGNGSGRFISANRKFRNDLEFRE